MAIPDFSRLPVTIHRWKLGKRQTIEISRDLVRVTEKGLHASKWDEPVSAFKGILRRRDEETQSGPAAMGFGGGHKGDGSSGGVGPPGQEEDHTTIQGRHGGRHPKTVERCGPRPSPLSVGRN